MDQATVIFFLFPLVAIDNGSGASRRQAFRAEFPLHRDAAACYTRAYTPVNQRSEHSTYG